MAEFCTDQRPVAMADHLNRIILFTQHGLTKKRAYRLWMCVVWCSVECCSLVCSLLLVPLAVCAACSYEQGSHPVAGCLQTHMHVLGSHSNRWLQDGFKVGGGSIRVFGQPTGSLVPPWEATRGWSRVM